MCAETLTVVLTYHASTIFWDRAVRFFGGDWAAAQYFLEAMYLWLRIKGFEAVYEWLGPQGELPDQFLTRRASGPLLRDNNGQKVSGDAVRAALVVLPRGPNEVESLYFVTMQDEDLDTYIEQALEERGRRVASHVFSRN